VLFGGPAPQKKPVACQANTGEKGVCLMIQQTPANSKLKAALAYAKRGWAVLPIKPTGKAPATKHGVHDATCDPEKIRRWWTRNPNYNIGVAAGQKSGLVVIDVDPRNGGDESFADWIKANGQAPETLVQLTPSGGHHLIFRWQQGSRKRELAAGIDVLSDGSYFLVSPSEINNRVYQWEISTEDNEPADLPASWLSGIVGETGDQAKISKPEVIAGQRNNSLTAIAGYLRHGGLSESEILSAITTANEQRCKPPLPLSEVKQIAASVSRYEPEKDILQDSALGTEAADGLLNSNTDQFLLPVDEFCSSQQPVNWLIKRWLPQESLVMVHGESGAGKTFVVLDMVMRLATGGDDWNGCRVSGGPVVFLAGEGHAGLKQRIQAWRQYHGGMPVALHISKHGLGLDTPQGFSKVRDSIKQLARSPVAIVVDTLHSHMDGDENVAKDSGKLIAACKRLVVEFGCTVLLVHHVGHNIEAKQRARGSSAWRAALDIEINVSRKKGKLMIRQTKAKDFELAAPLWFDLDQVEINGWFDDDGEPVRSCVLTQSEAENDDTNRGLGKWQKMFSNAWVATGADLIDEKPYISRAALRDYLIDDNRLSATTAAQYVKPSAQGKLISELLLAECIKPAANGWCVTEPVWASGMILCNSNQ
jgi:hypothetical protein